jgi:serine phosphatase RsbU (regulator of sigma subunit)
MKFPFSRSESGAICAEPSTAELPQLAGADIAGLICGKRVGGDFYQFARANPQRVVFGLLDVAGDHRENKGIVEAARAAFHDSAACCLANSDVNEADAMMEFCQTLNAGILRAAGGVRQCAAFLGCYNEELGTVCYVNAGHTPGLLRYDSDVSELEATGMPLGLFSASTYEAPTAAVPAGGGLLLASRGMVEANRKREEYGLARLRQHFLQIPLTNARDVAASALEAVQQFDGNAATKNDLTTLVVLRKRSNGW